MGCKECERRRKALAEKRRKKQEQGKPVQAAALGAVLAVSEAAGKAIDISADSAYMSRLPTAHGEEPHAQDRDDARRNEGVQASSGQL
jgi:hypothetical protein